MDELTVLAELLRQKNAHDARLSAITGRPATSGHTGEFIASRIFSIELHASAVVKGSDGIFRAGPLAECTVNIKWYGRQESVLDINVDGVPDYYLVLSGPWGSVASRGGVRPWVIDAVYLFDAQALLAELATTGVKVGVATGVRKHLWRAAEVYPEPTCPLMQVTTEQHDLLRLFASPAR